MTTLEKVGSVAVVLLIGAGIYWFFIREAEGVVEAAKPPAGGGGGGAMPSTLPGYGNLAPSAAPVPAKAAPIAAPPTAKPAAVIAGGLPKPGGGKVATLGADARVSWSSANGYTC